MTTFDNTTILSANADNFSTINPSVGANPEKVGTRAHLRKAQGHPGSTGSREMWTYNIYYPFAVVSFNLRPDGYNIFSYRLAAAAFAAPVKM